MGGLNVRLPLGSSSTDSGSGGLHSHNPSEGFDGLFIKKLGGYWVLEQIFSIKLTISWVLKADLFPPKHLLYGSLQGTVFKNRLEGNRQ